MRVKRHSESDRISSYATFSDVQFWGGASLTFDGLEVVPLAAGYRWDSFTARVGSPVISYREGKQNVIWAVEVDSGGASGAIPVTYTPVLPNLPEVDLSSHLVDEQAEESDGR